MSLNVVLAAVHRPGPLKQSNKKHKGEKGNRISQKVGKVDVKTISRSSQQSLNRKDRKHKANQLRKKKREAILSKKRGLGSASFVPILTAIIPLHRSLNATEFLEKIKQCDCDIETKYDEVGNFHISFPRQKQRFTFVIPSIGDIHTVMDVAKVVDRIVFLHSVEAFDDHIEMLLSTILSHTLPANVHVVQGLNGLTQKKKSEVKKEISKKIESRFPDEKLFHGDTEQELQLLLRHIACQKEKPMGFRDKRPRLLAERVGFDLNNEETSTGTLKVSGYICGQTLNVNRLIHIPGWGTYQMSQIVYENDVHSFHQRKKSTGSSVNSQDITMSETVVDKPDPVLQESLKSEEVPDTDGEDEDFSISENVDDDDATSTNKSKKVAKRVAEGTSEYQAAWIIEDDDKDETSDDTDVGSDDSIVTAADTLPENEEMDLDQSDSEDDDFESANEELEDEQAKKNEDPSDYDKDINMEEEKKMLVRFREERMEQMFPDERDTPLDTPAKIRYQKYRGLKNFKETVWDLKENLPSDYGRIYCFENFCAARKKVLSSVTEGALPGSYVTLHIADVPQSLYDAVQENHSLVIYGLLPHEQKMSLVNVVIKKHPTCRIPIKSKDSLIFHVGFRRFVCQPIFSTHGTGNKFKYEKFLPNSTMVVASFYAPVTFPPASAVIFQQKANGQAELVATGSVLNVDPNRVIVKRIVLSGHPFKILKRSAVVRYMFFNREDINWFKKVELRTKQGRRGHIKEPLGSHGHMKCVFDHQLQSQDSVLMSLYKRVFPKWTYDPVVPTLASAYDNESMFI